MLYVQQTPSLIHGSIYEVPKQFFWQSWQKPVDHLKCRTTNNNPQLDFIHLQLSYDQKPSGWTLMSYDISSSTNFLNPVSEKMAHLSQWTCQYLSQSISAKFSSFQQGSGVRCNPNAPHSGWVKQTLHANRKKGHVGQISPIHASQWFQSMISIYN